MDSFYKPGLGWSEPTLLAWSLAVQSTRPVSHSQQPSIDARIVAAGAAGANLSAQNAQGLSLIVLASRVMDNQALARLIEQSSPVEPQAQQKAIASAGRFLDSGATAKTLRASFAARAARHLEQQALESSAGPAPDSRKPPRV